MLRLPRLDPAFAFACGPVPVTPTPPRITFLWSVRSFDESLASCTLISFMARVWELRDDALVLPLPRAAPPAGTAAEGGSRSEDDRCLLALRRKGLSGTVFFWSTRGEYVDRRTLPLPPPGLATSDGTLFRGDFISCKVCRPGSFMFGTGFVRTGLETGPFIDIVRYFEASSPE